jgi:hypothetical protein
MDTMIFWTGYILFGIFTVWFSDKYAQMPFFKHEDITIRDVILYMFMLTISPFLFAVALVFVVTDNKYHGPVLFKRKLK